MKKALKVSGIAVLMLGFLLSSFSYFFLDTIEAGYKFAALEEIHNEKKLEVLVLPLAIFNQSREDNELRIAGRLYDIASYKIKGAFVTVTAYHDQGEEGLENQMSASFEEQDQPCNNYHYIGRHKLHRPDEVKMLSPIIGISFVSIDLSTPKFSEFPQSVTSTSVQSVLEPPPNHIS